MSKPSSARRTCMVAVASCIVAPNVVLPSASAAELKPLAEIGRAAPAFDVPDAEGRHRTLAAWRGKPVVLEWTSPTCPFAAAQYASGRMQALQQWARQHDIVWATVLSSHPSRPDYLEGPAARAWDRSRGGMPTALLIDADGSMGHAYGAMTANHMFVIDAKGVLRYAGGIDDSMSTKPDEVANAHNYVRAALEDLLSGRPVQTATSEPAGCAIAYAG
ncbi:MAG TPA: redoxin domain-containing protein [Caldimonas sp.]|nr:redoxin domain-containing protein [Caldimonas sp.]